MGARSFEKPLKADFAFVYAKQADYIGNLTYSLTARNFNPVMAMAADVVIAEAQDIVPVGGDTTRCRNDASRAGRSPDHPGAQPWMRKP